MKKFIKIFFITLLSLLAVLIVAVSIAIWIVFTPSRITPIVRKQAAKYLTCKSEIGDVELTFFSTFPNFGLKVRNFTLINPTKGSMSDTLVRVNELVGVVDAKAYWKNKQIILVGLQLNGGSFNVFSDSLGITNYNIVKPDSSSTSAAVAESKTPDVDIRHIEMKDVNLNYKDLALKLSSFIRNLTGTISGKITADNIAGNLKISKSHISFEYDGEKYLQDASIRLDLPLEVIPSRQLIRIKNSSCSVNDLDFLLDGTIEENSVSKDIITDLSYKLSSWPVKNTIQIIPPSFYSYFKGIEAEGSLASEGTIKGIINDKMMPLLEIHMSIENGTMKYPGFNLPLHDMKGDVTINTDLLTDSISFVRINSFYAKTAKSDFKVTGVVSHLFKDISCDLSTDASVTLDEFNQMIPESLKMKIKGKASGNVKSRFTMNQIEKMQIEKMKLSGSVALSDFDVKYDSITLKADRSKVDFFMPYNYPATKSTKFVYASVQSENTSAAKLAGYSAYFKNMSLSFGTSDIRDTSKIPDLFCTFKLDSLSAGVDTMSVSIANPHGEVSLEPREGNPSQPHIKLAFDSDKMRAKMNQNLAVIKKISTSLDIVNDNTQKDIFLQWLVRGYVDINKGLIRMSGLTNPIVIPSVKMDFDPETFSIRESSMKIGKSDFQLSGKLDNVLSYFRGDSILRGKFDFISNKTDVAQLMALTSGIGTYDSTSANKYEDTKVDTVATGPYMVPKKIDIVLNANVKQATMGVDTATNIKGAVQIHDGILLLDGLSFDTPAARMQLTAMYRTPRKNHLYLGIDYHMMDVEISELLTMIPDIDSLMPMLRSFGGRGEFHIAAETYLDSLYNVKKSTLRGAASIAGNNLVLMDGETFSEIAKKLRFSKKTQNKVDSLAAEFTIFRNEIDIYPFLIVMDKYKAVIAGRHNFDLTYDYHISVVDCPLPIKLGIDIKGNTDHMSYNLAPCKYAQYFRPSSRHEVENKQLELRKMIRQTLAEKVKE